MCRRIERIDRCDIIVQLQFPDERNSLAVQIDDSR